MTMIDRWLGRQTGRNVPQRRDEDRSVDELQRSFHDLVDDMFRRAWVEPGQIGQAITERGMGFQPRIDVREDDDNVYVHAELPGMKREDIDLRINRDHLTIQGEKRSEQERDEGGWHQVERSYGRFRRTVPLPMEVDRDRCDASFKDGVLEIKVPKTEQARRESKRVEVRGG